ncbi:error-prone DNA polymerase [Dermatobacter hominis]|uniref:error-prone DNA polymerase n=1 Tax=Dermatobacter hominis TaxID=2884263 RepID=UPI001D10A387|nr:error-prone DNA polymerase [Dermatobacter hominis]UDY36994.1 error-prone DNA polymerase [Dermatobacter hominis]
MGFNNPDVPWSEIERRLSDRGSASDWWADDPMARRHREPAHPGDGGDSPAWSRHREEYRAPADLGRGAREGGERVPYAELHCHSAFSFLDGASQPEVLAEEAARLGLDALAITDHHGFYGVVRFSQAARALGLPTVFGAELTLNAPEARPGPADPSGRHLLVLARDTVGYARLASLLSQAQMAGEKGRPQVSFADLAEAASGRARGHWAVLTGCRKGTVPAALVDDGPASAERELRSLVAAFGAEHTFVELWDHGQPLDSARNDALAELAVRAGVQPIATNNVHHATPAERDLAAALAAVRARRSLDELDAWLPAGGQAHLRSGAEQARRFARYPGVVGAAAELGRSCAFDLRLVAPELPPYPCPPDPDDPTGAPMTEARFLRHLVEEGATRRYGSRRAEDVPGAWAQIDRELDLIEALGFPGYFLIVWDIVEFCRRADILCQGRGSAANSAVCFSLGVTKADAVRLGLLFERFLSPERDGPPDIDLDIESGRREEVIQYVYDRYGRSHTAQVANVITYRSRSAVRDAAKALGFAAGQQDAWSKELDRWGGVPSPGGSGVDGGAAERDVSIPGPVLALAERFQDLPRHLGIHSGGMVICDRPVVEVCPTEWARMENRSVLQWDKDDCAAAGLVKFDLLGLGMLSALHGCLDLLRDHQGIEVDLAAIPQEDAVYDMLCRADSVGVFQVESRAQMATLPRLRPRCFYDLVVEVALIRPGPIQGGSVHPYIRRRKGEEPITYLHPLLEPALTKTLGVPLFQEQLMQMAIDVAGFSPSEADQLRQAMASKRSQRRMAELRQRFFDGLAVNDITGDTAVAVWEKLAAFANYGFPESHSVSFAYLVYASSWLKYHHPAAFCAALLNAQPMGFYSPQSLTQDAVHHGVEVRTPDLNASAADATLEPPASFPEPGANTPGSGNRAGGDGGGARERDDGDPATWGRGGPAVRLGISSVRGIGDDLAAEIAEGRPYADVGDLARRVRLSTAQMEAMATAGAFGCFDGSDGRPLDRRRAIWTAGAAARAGADRLPGVVVGMEAPRLPGMDEWEESVADLWSTGVSPGGHPTRFLRERLDGEGVLPATALRDERDGTIVRVAGVVTHRQRPATASGVTFLNLEDETGLINIVCSIGCWTRFRTVLRSAAALVVRGKLERSPDGVVNVVAHHVSPLQVAVGTPSRDFR